jgi:hypothetical protein
VTALNVAQVAARKLVFIADLPSRLVDVNRRLEEQRLVQLEASLQLNQRVGLILDQDELLATMTEIIGSRYAYDGMYFYVWSHNDRTLTRMEHAQRRVRDFNTIDYRRATRPCAAQQPGHPHP